ncbi:MULTISPECIES: hypothetical protein [unclassified Curtobacterium]|uniref:hypothetical protein n=1 Tax=unclassified Curtobacterium TaxID=257496 RepID=UPI0008DCEAFD|nr:MULTISPECIES: hypothetical protein [unclassified Curtobacterium]OIH98496.1 hypothetical protein BIU92_12045 [Curtobacterium sp. MCBA15_003]OII32221.1 hypothetical protein BIU94_02375 [Curtobacterium sp. MMLR14_006]
MHTTPAHPGGRCEPDLAERWSAPPDGGDAWAWVLDRSATVDRHLVAVHAVARTAGGDLVVDLVRPGGTPLAPALDRIGTLTTGVAVTLSVPLLAVVLAARDGTVLLGTAAADDVVVDDAGAVVLCDHPPGATPTGPGATARPSPATSDAARTAALAARTVWDRVDPADPARAIVDPALEAAVDGDRRAAVAALDAVRASAAPRPFRWDPAPADLVFAAPAPAPTPPTPFARLQDAVEHGLPIGDRRVPLRRLLIVAVVVVGSVVASVLLAP